MLHKVRSKQPKSTMYLMCCLKFINKARKLDFKSDNCIVFPETPNKLFNNLSFIMT